VTGFLGYVVLAPAVHGFHHRDGALLLDMALRIGLPLLGAAASSHTYLPLALFTPAGGAGATAGTCHSEASFVAFVGERKGFHPHGEITRTQAVDSRVGHGKSVEHEGGASRSATRSEEAARRMLEGASRAPSACGVTTGATKSGEEMPRLRADGDWYRCRHSYRRPSTGRICAACFAGNTVAIVQMTRAARVTAA
jgi:hypothetical protein